MLPERTLQVSSQLDRARLTQGGGHESGCTLSCASLRRAEEIWALPKCLFKYNSISWHTLAVLGCLPSDTLLRYFCHSIDRRSPPVPSQLSRSITVSSLQFPVPSQTMNYLSSPNQPLHQLLERKIKLHAWLWESKIMRTVLIMAAAPSACPPYQLLRCCSLLP